jgi:short-subunit dehydrogenase
MPTALITGASTGIGRDLAFECARAGYDLAVVARNRNQLESLAAEVGSETGRHVLIIAEDLTRPEAPAGIREALRDCAVDVLINNAGVALRGMFHELPVEKQMAMLQLNVNALTHLTRLFLPAMVERRKGRVMNVASTAAFQPGPLMAVYYASKAYVLSLSEALHNEVREFGVIVTALCPGPTETEFGTRAEMSGTRLFESENIMSSAEVARAGFQALMDGKPAVIPGRRNAVIAFATRLVPRQVAAGLARKMQEKK